MLKIFEMKKLYFKVIIKEKINNLCCCHSIQLQQKRECMFSAAVSSSHCYVIFLKCDSSVHQSVQQNARVCSLM